MMRTIVMLLGLTVSVNVVGVGVATGYTERPYGGAITVLAISLSDPNVLYVGTHQGEIFRSTDAGETWKITGLKLPKAVSTVFVRPDDPWTVYAASRDFGYHYGLFQTRDGGDNWRHIGPSPCGTVRDMVGSSPCGIVSVAGSPADPGGVYVGMVGGIFCSRDDGETWVQLNDIYGWSLAVSPEDAEIVYAGTSLGRILNSVDGGTNWREVYRGESMEAVVTLAVSPKDARIVYAGTDGPPGDPRRRRILRSTDAGDTWQEMTWSFGTHRIRSLAVSPEDPQVVYVGTDGGGIFRSLDGGESWTAINGDLLDREVRFLVVSPADDRMLYAAIWSGLFRSRDGGESWEEIDRGIIGRDVRCVLVSPEDEQVVYIGTFWGVSRSTDGGTAWADRNAGLANTDVYALAFSPEDVRTIYAGTRAGIFRSTDAGEIWHAMTEGIGSPMVRAIGVSSEDPGILYAGTDRGVFRSIDGGRTWAGANGGLSEPDIWDLTLSPDPPEILYATGAGGVFRSEDPAMGWDRISDVGAHSLAIHPTNPGKLYVGVEEDVLFTEDRGTTWTGLDLGVPVNDVTMDGDGRLWIGTRYGLRTPIYGKHRYYVSATEQYCNRKSGQIVSKEKWDQLPGFLKGTCLAPYGDELVEVDRKKWLSFPSYSRGPVITDPEEVLEWVWWGTSSGILDDDIRCVTLAPSEAIWLGTASGISAFHPPAGVHSVSVYPDSLRVVVGETHPFVAEGIGPGGEQRPLSPVWDVYGDVGVIDGSGTFTATDGGVGLVVAEADWVAASAVVYVEVPAPVKLISITGAAVSPDTVVLRWDVGCRARIYGWEVYRSGDGVTFDRIGEVQCPLGMTSRDTTYTFVDASVSESGTCFYRLDEIGIDGTVTLASEMAVRPMEPTGVKDRLDDETTPEGIALCQNYPNPFNAETTIRCTLSEPTQIQLVIYDASGRRVRTLVDKEQVAGQYSVIWDGEDDEGEVVASGIYFYCLETDEEYRKVRRMLLLR